VAFAPKDNPKIAIAVFVENGYWGSRWAGPITSLMIEKYIKKKITRTDLEKRMLEGSLQAEYNKYLSKPIVDTLKSKIDSGVKAPTIKPEVKSEKPQIKQKDSQGN
jgi:penicillin-binding protein 2